MDNLMKTASRMSQHDLDLQSKVLLPRMCMNLKMIRTILKVRVVRRGFKSLQRLPLFH